MECQRESIELFPPNLWNQVTLHFSSGSVSLSHFVFLLQNRENGDNDEMQTWKMLTTNK